MKTLEEFKYYYSNAGKEDLLIEAYEYYTNSHDMTNLVFQLQQEKEELIKWIEEETLRLSESVKHIESRSVLNRTPQLYIEKGAISMLKEILSKLKESGTGDKDNI